MDLGVVSLVEVPSEDVDLGKVREPEGLSQYVCSRDGSVSSQDDSVRRQDSNVHGVVCNQVVSNSEQRERLTLYCLG